MENLKIRVNSESESKEAQELFFDLGAECCSGLERNKNVNFLFMNSGFVTACKLQENFDKSKCKEITLPELRDMVVLKRNDVGDATHTDGHYSFYVGKDKNYFFSSCDKAWRGTWKNVEILKPIEKPMKEYLRKNSNGTYSYIGTVQPENISQNVIEIPEESETFNFYDRKDNLFFLKGGGEDTMFSNDLNDWDWKHWGDIDFDRVVCLWQRHTHPEELPFIDDEPKITTAKGSELDYIAKIHDMRDRYNGESDEDYRYQLEHYISRKEPSLNDQYAEIEKVRQTLNQRQEQYGTFEDVAMITEQMVDVMRKGYYGNLAYNQKMALYMICSKMARIVNGNPNHKDSWHDIAGYATLIDNELVSEKDMPF